ncbi:hypothetical protein [Arthrobacter sp. EPSL27]|uniref:hypothetical protein n=1 Tax=Arthrobacter sp. EPSL27 TaxID=1745378 RepID=UPI00074667A4|nr:hypothetical protein [Arthrobacter sp. EPSL27]KUM37705.1 hypothetical protein AR539_10845 [Arthrobacter sp. EPSL27]
MNPATARTTDFIGEEPVVSIRALAAAIAEAMTRKGYSTYDDDYNDRILVYRTGDAPEKITVREMQDRTRAAILAILADTEKTDDTRTSRLARTTRRLIEQRVFGAQNYVAKVAAAARDLLPMLSEEEHDAIREAINPTTKRTRTQYVAEFRAKQGAQHREEALEVLRKWAAGLPAGRHDLGDVWAAWRQAVTSSAKVACRFPGAVAIGRTKFYELLPEVGTVVTGHARKRYLVIPGA